LQIPLANALFVHHTIAVMQQHDSLVLLLPLSDIKRREKGAAAYPGTEEPAAPSLQKPNQPEIQYPKTECPSLNLFKMLPLRYPPLHKAQNH
jgi:hypothetical protein